LRYVCCARINPTDEAWAHRVVETRAELRLGGGRFVENKGIIDNIFPGGNSPFQPTVTVNNVSVDNPGAALTKAVEPAARSGSARRTVEIRSGPRRLLGQLTFSAVFATTSTRLGCRTKISRSSKLSPSTGRIGSSSALRPITSSIIPTGLPRTSPRLPLRSEKLRRRRPATRALCNPRTLLVGLRYSF
jgi:hypothetical protein